MENKSSLLYWYLQIKDLGIPTPKTSIIRLTPQEIEAYRRCEGDCFDLGRLEQEIKKTIETEFQLPVFIRTDEFSNKHFWKMSCYLDDKKNIKRNLMEIVSESKLADFLGGLPMEAICVREFIPMDTKFYAFAGEMPVNPERRYFIRDGKVECHHAYWIEEAVERVTSVEKLPKNWKEIAKKMNNETGEEINFLTEYSQRVANVLGGYWSVDFCKAKDGRWILIDMAEGEKSWHPSDCRYSNMPKEKFEKPDFDSWIIRKEE